MIQSAHRTLVGKPSFTQVVAVSEREFMMSLQVNALLMWLLLYLSRSTDPFHAIPGKLKFIHSSLSIAPTAEKGDGVFVTKNVIIPMGSVLVVEEPLAYLPGQSLQAIVEWLDKLRKEDIDKNTCSNTKSLESLFISPNHLNVVRMTANRMKDRFSKCQLNDVARFYSNAIGDCLFGFVSKFNHGFPTNIVMSFINLPIPRMVVFATKDLHFGEELQFDYFGIVEAMGSAKYKQMAGHHGIDIFGCEPFRNQMFQKMIDGLSAEFQKGNDMDYAKVVEILKQIIQSGLATKLFSNCYSPSLLYLMHAPDDGQFAELLKEEIPNDVCWEMYSMEAWRDYSKSSVGTAPARQFMGKEYNVVMEELRSLDLCQ